MAKKIKKFSRNINSPRRGGEKFNRALRQYSIALGVYVVLVLLAWGIGSNSGEYDLSNPTWGGFAVCFLLLPAYLPLLIIGGIAGIASCNMDIACNREVMILALTDIFIAGNVWWIIWLIAKKRQSASFLRSAKVFVWIMVYWGIFQLSCSLFYFAWQKSNFNAMHLHHRPQQEMPGQL